jgi:clan AA aspartic protease
LTGLVDDQLRALLEIEVSATEGGEVQTLMVWIDTAFNGQLVVPRSLIDQIGLKQLAVTEAVLANGSQVLLETYQSQLQWFGRLLPVQIVANDGKMPLLGTELLSDRLLLIDYGNRILTLD